VNPDAFNAPVTLYVLYTFYICCDYQIIALASLAFTYISMHIVNIDYIITLL